jgi:hypothetical protein
MDKQLFFAFGQAKSGTTFLQRTLNLHPEVSCSSEHQFTVFIDRFQQLFKQYDNLLALVDKRTGGQGIIPTSPFMVEKLFRYTVECIIEESAKDKGIAGANDNAILYRIEAYNELFDSPKFIVIFRNPIDTAISAWHHNMRLAKEENNPNHEQFMTKHGGFEGWLKFAAELFSQDVKRYKAFAENHNNIIMVRYEDLLRYKKNSLLQLFHFLGASTCDNILNCIIEQSSLKAMRENSSQKLFFRSASITMGQGVISDSLRRIFLPVKHMKQI